VAQESRNLSIKIEIVNVTIEGDEFVLIDLSTDLLPFAGFVLYTLLMNQ